MVTSSTKYNQRGFQLEPRFTLRQIRYFLAAAQGGSVSQASNDVNISAPSISVAISQLEEHFKIQLFVRHHSRGLLLTADGKKFFTAAKEFFEHAEKLENEAQGLGNAISGVIYAGCFTTLAPFIIPLVSNAFSKEYPDSKISFVEGHQASLINALRDGIVQVAFTYKMNLGRDLIFDALGEVSPYCILPKDHRFADQESVDITLLEDDPMVLLDLPKSREYYMSLFEQAGVTPNVSHRTTSQEVVRVMVSHGLGYSILAMPTHHAVAVDGSEFVIKPLAKEFPKLSVGLLASVETASTHIYETVRDISQKALDDLFSSH